LRLTEEAYDRPHAQSQPPIEAFSQDDLAPVEPHEPQLADEPVAHLPQSRDATPPFVSG